MIFLKNLHSIARIKTSREKENLLRRERREKRASETGGGENEGEREISKRRSRLQG
jgi:hypothetical protein